MELMEKKYGQAKRIWVMDRGMVSEDNIDFLRGRQARYLVGTPKSQLKRFEAQLLEKDNWAEVQAGSGGQTGARIPMAALSEQYVLCRSSARRQKEAAMIELARQRLRAQLDKTARLVAEASGAGRRRDRAAHRALAGALSRGRTAASRSRWNGTLRAKPAD